MFYDRLVLTLKRPAFLAILALAFGLYAVGEAIYGFATDQSMSKGGAWRNRSEHPAMYWIWNGIGLFGGVVFIGIGISILRPRKGRAVTVPDVGVSRDHGDMKEVTKEQFKETYFRLGGGTATGWTLEYWNHFFENEKSPPTKYLVRESETPKHDRMFISSSGNEHRLFFFTEESEESFFRFPEEKS